MYYIFEGKKGQAQVGHRGWEQPLAGGVVNNMGGMPVSPCDVTNNWIFGIIWETLKTLRWTFNNKHKIIKRKNSE